MKQVIFAIVTIAMVSCGHMAVAQDKKDEKKVRRSISISKDGVTMKANDSSKMILNKTNDDDDNESNNGKGKPRFKSSYMMLDLGLNLMTDNTNYSDPAVQALLNVPANRQNESLFNQRVSKSINVNIYPWMLKFAALRTKNQRIYISTGIGLQLYNFRYDEPLTFTKNPTGIMLDSMSFKKNKLATNYLSVPLMLTFKSRLYNDHWLAYGVGVTGNYRISTWTKQVTSNGGKTKSFDAFGTPDFTTSVNAEIGIDGAIRFYASYQLTSMFENGLDQHPVCFGIRFNGM